jgi:hypothetical protein
VLFSSGSSLWISFPTNVFHTGIQFTSTLLTSVVYRVAISRNSSLYKCSVHFDSCHPEKPWQQFSNLGKQWSDHCSFGKFMCTITECSKHTF